MENPYKSEKEFMVTLMRGSPVFEKKGDNAFSVLPLVPHSYNWKHQNIINPL
jgi:hypothetical protein